MPDRAGAVMESGRSGGGDRCDQGFDRAAVILLENISGNGGFICVDSGSDTSEFMSGEAIYTADGILREKVQAKARVRKSKEAKIKEEKKKSA